METKGDFQNVEQSYIHHGNNVLAFRRMKGWNQKKLASALNMSQQNISQLEAQKVIPDETLTRIAAILGVDIDILKNYTDDCKVTIINENDITANDSSSVRLGYENQNNYTNYYNPDKALEVIETVLKDKNEFTDYLKEEIRSLKKENEALRKEQEALKLEIRGLQNQIF